MNERGIGLSIEQALASLVQGTSISAHVGREDILGSVSLSCPNNDRDIYKVTALEQTVDGLIMRYYGHLVGGWENDPQFGTHRFSQKRLFEPYVKF